MKYIRCVVCDNDSLLPFYSVASNRIIFTKVNGSVRYVTYPVADDEHELLVIKQLEDIYDIAPLPRLIVRIFDSFPH